MYNFKLKEFQNGTCQLVYYHNPIYLKEDRPLYKDFYPEGAFDAKEYCLNLENPFLDSFEKRYVTNLYSEGAELAEDDIESLDEDVLKDRSLKSSMNRSKKAIYDYGRSNVWEWFFTLTFERNEEFTAENYDECKKKCLKWFHNIKDKYCHDLKYLIVPEMHHESNSWHFHALVSNCNELNIARKENIAINQQEFLKDEETHQIILDRYGNPKPNKYYGKPLRVSYPDGDFIYNISQYKNGFSTATRIKDTKKAVSYIVKYITKDMAAITSGKRRYLPSNNLNTPITNTALLASDQLNNIITDIQQNYNVKLATNCIKTYKIDVPGYSNAITVFEFDPRKEGDNIELVLHDATA